MRQKGLFIFRIFATLISLFGMGYRLIYIPFSDGGLSQFINMLGYFTIQSGMLVLFVFVSLLVEQLRGIPGEIISANFRGGALLYIVITSAIYLIMLDPVMEETGLSRFVLYINHLGTALLLLADHLISVKPGIYKWSVIPKWLIYPFAYLFFSLAEGLFFCRFRYYFLNFRELGTVPYLLFLLMLIAVFSGVGALIVLINRLRGRNTTS